MCYSVRRLTLALSAWPPRALVVWSLRGLASASCACVCTLVRGLIHVMPTRPPRHRHHLDTSLQPSTRSPPSPLRPRPLLPPPTRLLARRLQVPALLISSLLPASRGSPTFFFEGTPQKRTPQYLSPCVTSTHVKLELDTSPLGPRSGPHVFSDTL